MPGIDLPYVLAALLVLVVSLTVHETAHAWTADRLGDATARRLGRVSMNPLVHVDPIGTLLFPLMAIFSGIPLIGWAKPVPVAVGNLRRGRRDFVTVAAAGPLSNLALAVVASVALTGVGSGTGPFSTAALLSRMLEINLLLAVFNMVPVPPLDGGNVLAGLLPARAAQVVDGIRPYGFLVLYALMLTGTLGTLIGPPYLALLSWLR